MKTIRNTAQTQNIWQQIQDYVSGIKSNLIRLPLEKGLSYYAPVDEINPDTKDIIEKIQRTGFPVRLSVLWVEYDEVTHYLYNENTRVLAIINEVEDVNEDDIDIKTVFLSDNEDIATYLCRRITKYDDSPIYNIFFDKDYHDLNDREIFEKMISELSVEHQKYIADEDTEHKLFFRIVRPVPRNGIEYVKVTEIIFDNNMGDLHRVLNDVYVGNTIVSRDLEYSRVVDIGKPVPTVLSLFNKLCF